MAKALKWTEPLAIPEKVTVKPDGTAVVSLGSWSFPLTETAGYDKPEYRARLMAGALYLGLETGGTWMNPIS